jgi:hypothetical protein
MPYKANQGLPVIQDQAQSSGTHEQNYSLSIISMQFYNTPSNPRWRPDSPWGPGARCRCFLTLMVHAPKSPSAPAKGPTVDVF